VGAGFATNAFRPVGEPYGGTSDIVLQALRAP